MCPNKSYSSHLCTYPFIWFILSEYLVHAMFQAPSALGGPSRSQASNDPSLYFFFYIQLIFYYYEIIFDPVTMKKGKITVK